MVRNSPHCVFHQPVSVQFADYCKVPSLAMTSRRTADRRRQVPKMTLVGSPGRAVSLPADAKSHVMVQPAQRFHRSIPAPALQHRPLPACSFHCLAGSGLCPKVWQAAGVFVLHAPSVPGLAKPMTQHFAFTRQLASCHAVLCLPERTCSRSSLEAAGGHPQAPTGRDSGMVVSFADTNDVPCWPLRISNTLACAHSKVDFCLPIE